MENTYKITTNPEFNSLEILFDGKPSEAVRDALKALRYRWHAVKKVWYGYSDEETVTKAIENAKNGTLTAKVAKDTQKAKKAVKTAEKANKYGVKVGDVFCMSWGYEQTQVDFFQVKALCGENSVRVVNVNPIVVKTAPTCAMAEDRTYKLTAEPMPVDERSIFIKDSVKGDLKRLNDFGDGKPYIRVGDHLAYKRNHGECTEYVSWYY